MMLALAAALVTTSPDGREVWFYETSDSAARLLGYLPLVGRMSATGTDIKALKILFDADGRVRKCRLQAIRVR